MPVKIKTAYNANTNAGDSINDEDYLAFEQDLAGSASNSWATKFSQLVSYLSGKFYPKAEADTLLGGKIPQVSGADTHAVVQDANGNLVSTGLPMATMEMSTIEVPDWAQGSSTLRSHDLTDTPSFTHVTGVFLADSNGWLTGEKISLGLGNVGTGTLSSMVIEMDAANFRTVNGCTSANALLIPVKGAGTTEPVAVGEGVIRLDITFMRAY